VHVLRRPFLPHAAAVTATGAALALALTLLLAGTRNDFGSVSGSGSSAAAAVSVGLMSTGPGWNRSPFTRLLRSPVPVPWAAGSRS
jgi:ABC-type Fe3+-siderophore transport system permease subunit